MLVVTGVIAMGHMFFSYIMTVSASREGTRYGSVVGVNEEGIVQYRDCDSIRAAARRVGWFANITDEDITITYDSGAGHQHAGELSHRRFRPGDDVRQPHQRPHRDQLRTAGAFSSASRISRWKPNQHAPFCARS
jgi:hypothetical protein